MPSLQNKTRSPIYGVILAGGEGKRLWPVSRRIFPKYCINIGSCRSSLFQQAYERLRSITGKDRIFVVTQKAQVDLVKKQVPALPAKNIIAEPFARNTAAAIGLAAVIIGRVAPSAVMAVVPADQFIPDTNRFAALMKSAVRAAQSNNSLVTIGIKPTYPATGYGYIKTVAGHRLPVAGKRYKAYKVEKFVEKPNLATAKRFIKAGYLWNSGMFVWEVTAILEAIRDHVPRLFRKLNEIDNGLGTKKRFLSEIYKGLDNISIDNAVLEKSKKVFLIPTDLKWDDLGSWVSLTRMLKTDKNNNIIDANFKGIDTRNCIIISKDKRRLLAACGLKNIIIVQTPDVTLVSSCAGAQRIKELVDVSDHCFR